jgi:hypothetical protein
MRRHLPLELLGIGLGISLLAACPDRNVSQVDPNQNKVEVKDIPGPLNRDLDLLFVIDNSGSMDEEQAALTANFPVFTNVLETIEGGLPNIHLGVVSSDVGAGSVPGCTGSGDNGQFQTAAAITGNFITDIAADPPGSGNCLSGARDCNYTGSLATAFTDMAGLGIGGCGFEQHFESARRALNGSQGSNVGFLRDSAFLAVVFVQDEDDCSTMGSQMFDTSTAQDSPTSELGPLGSFRCNEFGIDCETGNEDPRAVGPRTNCFPKEDSPYMYGVDEFVEFFKDLKPNDEDLLIMAAITGPDEPYVVGRNPDDPDEPQIVASCTNPVGISCTTDADCPGNLLTCISGQCNSHADPAVRLHYFLDQFPQSASTTICSNDLSDGLQLIAELLKEAIGNPCIVSTLEDPIDCSVSDVENPDEDDEIERLLPECDADEPTPLDTSDTAASGNVPCWHLETDNTNCANTPTNLSLVIERNDASVPTGTHVRAQCVTCTDENENGTCDHAE